MIFNTNIVPGRINLLLLCFIFFNSTFSQTYRIAKGEFDITILHSRKLPKVQASTSTILRSDILKTVYVKFKMISNDKSKKEFDINMFSLVDEKNKIRSRPFAISYQQLTAYVGFWRLVHEPLNYKSFDLKYKPEIHDSFHDYDLNEFTTLEIPVNYGSFKNPKNYVVYFEPQKFKSKNLNFFFPFLIEMDEGTLYYGDEKVADLNFN